MSVQGRATDRRHTLWFWGSLVAWLAAWIVAMMAGERTDWPQALRVASALLPIPFFASFLAALVSGVRRMDELERRIQLEALAVAFPLAILLLMTLGTLQRVVALSTDDWSYRHVWSFLPLFYYVGLAVARRRYA